MLLAPRALNMSLGFAAAIFLLWSSPSLCAGQAEAGSPAAAPTESSAQEEQDCRTVGNLLEREACFAKQSDTDIEECEKFKPNACRPYKEMFLAERQLSAINKQRIAWAAKHYESYSSDDAKYISDLVEGIEGDNRTWRAYRDARCKVEPFLEGMSRVETYDLTEACRVEKTKDRIKELKSDISSLKAK